jgi:hypothetical protein
MHCSDVCNNIHFSIVFFLGFCVAATEAHGLKKILMEVSVNEKCRLWFRTYVA